MFLGDGDFESFWRGYKEIMQAKLLSYKINNYYLCLSVFTPSDFRFIQIRIVLFQNEEASYSAQLQQLALEIVAGNIHD